MNDEQAAQRGREAAKALEVLEPVFDSMYLEAVDAIIAAETSDDVFRHKLYAQAIVRAQKTLRSYVLNGQAAEQLAAKQ
mgnify:CR=1 FL=1